MFSTQDLCHCWYSPSQDRVISHSIYLIDGEEKKVTNATAMSKECAKVFNAADSVYLGRGVFVRCNLKTLEDLNRERPARSDFDSDEEWTTAWLSSLRNYIDRAVTNHTNN